MARRRRKRTSTPGASPGTLVVDPSAPKPVIRVIAYDEQAVTDREVVVADLPAVLRSGGVTWINVDGLGDTTILTQLAQIFGLHRLALEDVVSLGQRPKIEPYADHLFLVTHMVRFEAGCLKTEQLSLFCGKGWVLTFQEQVGDCFNPVRDRIAHGGGLIRKRGADYLTYALLDAVVDNMFPVVEAMSEALESLEENVLHGTADRVMQNILGLRRDLLALKRIVWPQRDALMTLLRDDSPLLHDDTRTHLRDCHDHAIRVLDAVEASRELASGLMELHMTVVSNRMNEVMKVLTIISTIFIPLSFVAGLYGMNFDPDTSPCSMPELRSYYGYPIVVGAMAATAGVMLYFFFKRGWIGRRNS